MSITVAGAIVVSSFRIILLLSKQTNELYTGGACWRHSKLTIWAKSGDYCGGRNIVCTIEMSVCSSICLSFNLSISQFLTDVFQASMSSMIVCCFRWYRAPEIMLNWMHYNQTGKSISNLAFSIIIIDLKSVSH